jgi:hypothetical protein
MSETRVVVVPYELGRLDALTRSFPVRAVSLTAYDPASDVEERVPPIALGRRRVGWVQPRGIPNNPSPRACAPPSSMISYPCAR